ncbi:cytochrome c oxidase assembly protein subunit 15 [Isoptericola jiangsuensis]|uniref:Cytochrome c oxidase assembly protein subunit 15 n=1 Tax=Isoptericola jiangsuensis TaxID=548579 RepID=A0A2A9EWP1_9MICO|nr:COX15/CtaA family protein [Isoptericola jiangsuensis]PFG42931.1 cytochrome c oxidase assembly protein subunit 15 [Isoptericola jiangsuensis]
MSTPAPAEPVGSAPAPTPAPLRFARFRGWTRGVLVANVVGQIAIIVTGGAVRLTDSGLGCSTWPHCEPGRFTPVLHEATSIHPYVEFGNRLITFVLAAIAIAVLLLVWTDRRRSPEYRVLGFVPLAGVVAQALIGGVVVLLHLHPGWVSLHFGVSAALVWFSAYLLRRHGEGDGAPVRLGAPALTVVGGVLTALMAAVVVLGVLVTGAGPHSGDTEVGYRLALDPYLVTRAHSATVWLFVATLVVLLVLMRRLSRQGTTDAGTVDRAWRAAWLLVVVTLAQALVGYVQYFTGLPEILVGVHMLGAGLLVWATANAVLKLRTRA